MCISNSLSSRKGGLWTDWCTSHSDFIPLHSNKMATMSANIENKGRRSSQLRLTESSPEKAGVGGSIPSLATIFSSSYSHPQPSFCSILFQ
jgi:hypothetical protein